MAVKSVYGLVFETQDQGLVVFYVGCTNDIVRRASEHKRNAFDLKSAEYDTYKYQLIRQLASLDIGFRLEVLTPAEEINDRSDEYSWVLKFADHNRNNGIEFYDGLPLTNMKAGDFLEEMLRDPAVRTPSEIRAWRKARADSIKQVRYNRNTFGIQGRNETMRKAVIDSMTLETVATRTEDVIKKLEKAAREKKRIAEIERERQKSIAYWNDKLSNGLTDEKIMAMQMLGLDPLK